VHISTKYMIMLSCTRLHVYIRASLVMYVYSRRLPTIIIVEFGETIKNPAYCILQTEYSGCLDISAHA